MLLELSAWEIALVVVCLFAGGILKGATGAGAPILAIPAISSVADVRVAIVTLLATTIVTNVWQAWTFSSRVATLPFLPTYLAAAGLGMVAGTVVLAYMPLQILAVALILCIAFYFVLRLTNPGWQLSLPAAGRMAVPAGLAAGLMQGGAGLSGPAAVTYLSALRLGRDEFAGAISLLFLVMGLVQLPSLALVGLLTWQGSAVSVAAVLPVALGMVAGSAVGKRLSEKAFDQTVLILLACLTAKLIWDLVGS